MHSLKTKTRTLGSAMAMMLLTVGTSWAQPDQECHPADQLVCACKARDIGIKDANWDACFLGDINYATLTQVDPFSAKAFRAINWPVKLDKNKIPVSGVPDFDHPLTGDWTTVWETWKSTNSIFLRDGAPLSWDSSEYPLPESCEAVDVDAAHDNVPYADQIPNDIQPRLLDEYLNPEGHMLVDSEGIPVRYDVIFNRQAYEYTVNNKLWSPFALETFLASNNNQLKLPEGTWIPSKRGAIVLKTSWKILHKKDDPKKFHKAWAYITPIVNGGKRSHGCELKPVGLVGMHLVYKTHTMPEWAWGTFEHDHAAPLWSEVGDTRQGVYMDGTQVPDWLFFSKNFEGAVLPNTPPKRDSLSAVPSRIIQSYPAGYYFGPVNSNNPGNSPRTSGGDPMTECDAGNQEFWCINQKTKNRFQHSVFHYYHLKGTQWREPGDNADAKGQLIPELLGNATMEPYTQTTSSCITCHSLAKTNRHEPKKQLDFIFSFYRDVLERSIPAQGK